MPSVVDTLLSELARSQQRQAYISSSGAGIQAGTEAFQMQRGQEDIAQQQLEEGLKGTKAGQRQQTRGLVGGGIGWLVGQIAKKAILGSLSATPVGLPAALLSAMPALLTYLGSRRGAKGADYKYTDIQVPEDISKGMFLQPERSQIAQDIRKIDIQGETMEDIHKAAGQSLALKLGATALPMGDILKSFAPAKAATDLTEVTKLASTDWNKLLGSQRGLTGDLSWIGGFPTTIQNSLGIRPGGAPLFNPFNIVPYTN